MLDGMRRITALRRRSVALLALAALADARLSPSSAPSTARRRGGAALLAQRSAVVPKGAKGGKRGLLNYFGGISLAGATACSVTHCLVVPLDVIKTRMQTDATLAGQRAAAAAVMRDAPGRGLLRLAAFFTGLPPTAVGYFVQGATKFGGYELCKQNAFARLRDRGGDELARRWQLPVMLGSAATAEMAATVLLAPLEVLKLRMQTDAASAARGVLRTLAHIVQHEGAGALYVGLTPIAMRQVPYTVTKLVAYEVFIRAGKSAAARLERAFTPDSPGALRPYAIVLAGLLAGAAAAVVSHPADLLLTRLCGAPTSALNTNVAECVIADGFVEQVKYLISLGVSGAYKGLAPRLLMTSAMTSVQFTIYEGVRHALGVAGSPPPKPSVLIPS